MLFQAKTSQCGGSLAESKPPLRLRGGGILSGSGSSSDEDTFISAAEELDLSPTLQHYETPQSSTETDEPSKAHPWVKYGITEKDYEYMMETEEHDGLLWSGQDWIVVGTDNDPDEADLENIFPSTPMGKEVDDDAMMANHLPSFAANVEDNGLLLDMQQCVDAKVKLQRFLRSTSPSKHNTDYEDKDTDPDKDDNNHRNDDDDATANLEYLIQAFDDGASKNVQQGGQNLGTGDSSWPNNYAGCEICQYRGFIAFHLRHSESCLRQLRGKPHFIQMKGSDEVFVVKFALLKSQCPSSTCSTGCHTVLPEECLEWWITEGWVTLGWKGFQRPPHLSIAFVIFYEFIAAIILVPNANKSILSSD